MAKFEWSSDFPGFVTHIDKPRVWSETFVNARRISISGCIPKVVNAVSEDELNPAEKARLIDQVVVLEVQLDKVREFISEVSRQSLQMLSFALALRLEDAAASEAPIRRHFAEHRYFDKNLLGEIANFL